jgi:hypothetical protein
MRMEGISVLTASHAKARLMPSSIATCSMISVTHLSKALWPAAKHSSTCPQAT